MIGGLPSLPMLIMWSSKFSQFVNSKSSNVLFLAGMSCICSRKQSSVTCSNLMGKLCNTALFSQQVKVMKVLHQWGARSIDTKLLWVVKLKFYWTHHLDWKVIRFQLHDDPSNLDRNSIELLWSPQLNFIHSIFSFTWSAVLPSPPPFLAFWNTL